jgi:hypothetical protein
MSTSRLYYSRKYEFREKEIYATNRSNGSDSFPSDRTLENNATATIRHYNRNEFRQHSFNNGYISNPLLKWLSDIIIILRIFLTTIYKKKILLK